MSDRLNLWLRAPHAAWLDPADTPLAMATLLVCLDDPDTPALRLDPRQIDRIIALRYDLTLAEAADLRLAAEGCAMATPRMKALAGLIRLHVPQSELIALGLCLCTVLRTTQAGQPAGRDPRGAVGRILGIDALSLVQAGIS